MEIRASSWTVPRGLDRVGFFMSAACAVHCALMPFVAGVLPLVGIGFLAGRTAEAVLVLAAAAIALVSLAGGCRHHKQRLPLLLVAAGFLLILTGRVLIRDPEVLEIALVVPGALLIAGAHLVNWRLCCVPRQTVVASDIVQIRRTDRAVSQQFRDDLD